MKRSISRRSACAAMLGVGGAVLAAGRLPGAERRGLLRRAAGTAQPALKNADFYGADGKFNAEAAKDAYFAMFKRFGYPYSDELRKTMWVTDFGLGRFLEVGMAGNFWINSQEYNFTSLEMFLLPDQMIPEHWHVALDAEKVPGKMEVWHVRHGSTFTYGEGPATPQIGVKIHESEKPFVTVMNETPLRVGQVVGIKNIGEKHWQQAGPQGAVITETSTFHSGAAVRFTNPKIKF